MRVVRTLAHEWKSDSNGRNAVREAPILGPGAAPDELAEIVLEIARVSPEPADTGPLLAQAPRTQGRTPELLPDTAGPLPLLALAGAVSLLGGLCLTIKRRLSSRK